MNTKTNSKRSIVIAVLALALPVLYLAASAHPVSARAASAQAPTSTFAPTAVPSPAAVPNPQSAPVSTKAPAAAPTNAPDDGVDSGGPTPPPPPPAPRAGVAGGISGPAANRSHRPDRSHRPHRPSCSRRASRALASRILVSLWLRRRPTLRHRLRKNRFFHHVRIFRRRSPRRKT